MYIYNEEMTQKEKKTDLLSILLFGMTFII